MFKTHLRGIDLYLDTFIADVIDVMVDNLSMADLISLFLGK